MLAGFYPKDAPAKSNQEAQIDMIEEVLQWAGVGSVKEVSRAQGMYQPNCTRI